jgi:ATP-dependent RNA helicase RhlE
LAATAFALLVLTPTRELAAQVEESVRDYGKYLQPPIHRDFWRCVGMKPQIDQASKRGVDMLVATPGRLLDSAQAKAFWIWASVANVGA